MTKEQLFNHLTERIASENPFYGHAVIDAEDEAMMVLMKVFSQSVEQVLATGNQQVLASTIELAEQFVNVRLTNSKPMAYVLGEVNFAGLIFKCDDRALVPRSPIAELILDGFEPWLNMEKVTTALDLCTGSGCIGISMAHYFPHLQVDISDLSETALSLAHENREKFELSEQVHIHASDLFQSLSGRYDLIVSNPPYVSEKEYQDLPKEYKQEPKMGLVTEFEGMRLPVEIMLNAPQYLTENGQLFLEVGYSDGVLSNCFPKINFQWVNFLNGGQGVCVFTRKMLLEYQPYFRVFLEKKHVV